MTTDLNIGVDWNRDGHICFNTTSADKLNTLKSVYPKVLDYSTFDYKPAGSSTISVVNSTEYPDLHHGLNQLKCVTSSGTLDGINVFTDGTNFPLTHDAPQTIGYYFRFWFKGLGFTPTETLNVEIRKNNGATLVAQSSPAITNNWQAVTISGSLLNGDTNLNLRMYKSNDPAITTFWFTGFMFFSDPVAVGEFTIPTNFNTGDTLDKYDNITDDVESVFWSGGVESYGVVAPEHRPQFTLQNTYPARKYSPEYSSSPFYGILPNDLKCAIIEIQSGGFSVDQAFYTGQIDVFQPAISIKGEQITYVELKSDFARIINLPIIATLQEATTTGAIISAYLQIAQPDIDVSQIATGETTINYFGDNSDLGDMLPVNAQGLLQYLTQLATAERGKLYPDSYGRVTFLDRDWLINNTVAYTLTDDFVIDEYLSAGETLINQVIVICYPRVEGSQETLSNLDKDMKIPAGEKRTFKTKYKNSNNTQVGGKTIVTPTGADYVITGGTPTLTANSTGGQESEWEIDNTSGTSDAVLSTFDVKGLPLSSFNGLEVVANDLPSQTLYGIKTMTLDLKAIDDPDVAFDIAERVLARFSVSSGEFRFIGLTKLWNSTDSINYLNLAFGDRLTLIEKQRGHERDYLVVGWSHSITGVKHDIGLFLEVATNAIDILVDEDFTTDFGVLSTVDTGSKFTAGSGAVAVASGGATGYIYDDNRTMSDGMALLVRYNRTTGTATYIKQSTVYTDLVGYKATNTIRPSNGLGSLTGSTWSSDAMNYIVIHVADDLELYLLNGRVQYLGDGDTAATLDFGMVFGGTDSGSLEHFRVASLGDVWASSSHEWADYYSQNPAVDLVTTPTQANHFIMVNWACATGKTLKAYTRRNTDIDSVEIRCSETANTIVVYANGVSVDSVAQTFTNGTTYKIAIHMNGTAIKTYVDDADKNSTTSSHNETVKGIKLSSDGSADLTDYFIVPYDYSNEVGINLLQSGVS